MITVELDIFSGRPNPVWTIDSETELKELIDRVQAEPSIIKPLSPVDSYATPSSREFSLLNETDDSDGDSDPDVGEGTPINEDTYVGTGIGDLGYRGYIISNDDPDNAWGKAGLPDVVQIKADQSSIESTPGWILGRSSKKSSGVSDDVMAAAQKSIKSRSSLIAQAKFTPCPKSYYTSYTDFSIWNGSAYVTKNNCYNFASNNRTNTFAQPGRGTGRQYSQITAADVLAAAQRDGWQTSCRADNNYNVCLVIWPGYDYHWYRLCSNGIWCHKPGQTPARNTDNSGRLITNPETCNRGNYTIFAGYLRGFNVRIN